ncbi:MAG: ribosome maturation factor RimM [Lachnospiraceae bacterium]|nr:ribosome maturation factor RimM [Lachnospiraceae bacterium]
MALDTEQLLQVGVISSMHGVHGEVKVFPTTSDANRYKKLKEVLLDTGKNMRESDIITLKLKGVKFFKQFVIVKFEGYDNPNDIEKYKGKPIYVTRENAVKLSKDEYFVADLYDIEVFEDNGDKLGVIVDVIETGSNDVYTVKCVDGKEILLPAIKQCILDVDIENRKMTVHVMDGLRD